MNISPHIAIIRHISTGNSKDILNCNASIFVPGELPLRSCDDIPRTFLNTLTPETSKKNMRQLSFGYQLITFLIVVS